MIHWGIFAIPAWAETVIDPGEWLGGKLLEPPDFGREFFTHIPYVEWYPNTILIPGSPAQAHHAATYGAGFPYEDFRPQFEAAAAAWSADAWADLFQTAGARYVVLVTKHHDGFSLWPTVVPHPTRPGWNMSRDVVGELTGAVRKRCMRMGLYYSGGFDWSIQPGPVADGARRAHRHSADARVRRLCRRPLARADRALSAGRAVERHRLSRHRQPEAALCRLLQRDSRRRHQRSLRAAQ